MIGAIFGYHFMDTLAHRTILSIAGWRCVFVAFGLLSASVAGIGYFLLFDPRRGQVELEEPSESEQRTVIAEESVTFQGVTVADVLDGMKREKKRRREKRRGEERRGEERRGKERKGEKRRGKER